MPLKSAKVKLTTNSPKIIQRWRRICGDRGDFWYEPFADFLWRFDSESWLESAFAVAAVKFRLLRFLERSSLVARLVQRRETQHPILAFG